MEKFLILTMTLTLFVFSTLVHAAGDAQFTIFVCGPSDADTDVPPVDQPAELFNYVCVSTHASGLLSVSLDSCPVSSPQYVTDFNFDNFLFSTAIVEPHTDLNADAGENDYDCLNNNIPGADTLISKTKIWRKTYLSDSLDYVTIAVTYPAGGSLDAAHMITNKIEKCIMGLRAGVYNKIYISSSAVNCEFNSVLFQP